MALHTLLGGSLELLLLLELSPQDLHYNMYIVHLRVGRWTCILYRSKDATPDRSVKIFRLGEIDIGCIINCTQLRSGWN